MKRLHHTPFRILLTAARTAALGITYLTVVSASAPPPPFFVAQYDLPGCYYGTPGNISVADVNNDGIPDLVCGGGAGVATFLGNGNGTFQAGPVSDIGNYGGGSPLPVDLNGDGNIDLITVGGSSLTSPGCVVTLGNGDGTFQFGTFYPLPDYDYPNYVAAGDFNGDGIVDFITATQAGVYIFLGSGNGVFDQGVLIPINTFNAFYQLAAADVNRDGKLDIVAGGLSVLLGNGDGTFQPEIDKFVPFGAGPFALGDFNSDGNLDAFVSTFSSDKAFLFPGEGNGKFQIALKSTLVVNSFYPIVAAADFSGDGFLDLLTSAGQIFRGNGTGFFSAPQTFEVPDSGYSGIDALPARLRDGLPDAVLEEQRYDFTAGYTSVFLNDGHGGFLHSQTTSVAGGNAHCAVSGDFNGDGIPDLAVGVDSGISILLGTGETSVPYSQGELLSYGYSSCPIKGDLNGDGRPDLLVTTSSNTVVAYLGNGDGTFTAAANPTSISANGSLGLGDFNGDGKLDFALTSNLLAYGNGDGTFQSPKPFIPNVVSSNISGIAAARLHQAATSDIVLTDASANLVYILLSHSRGFSETTFTPQQCSGPVNPVLADINGDGSTDLVLGCSGSTTPIYLNNGDGLFPFGTVVTSGFGASAGYPLVSDVNGDSIPDLLVQGDTALSIFTGQGGLLFSPPLYIDSVASPVLAVDTHGQKLASGKPDLITFAGTNVNVSFNATK